MKKETLSGLGVALVTPFKHNKKVDFNSLERIMNHINLGNIDYFVILGTTGESSTIDKKEREDLIKCVKNNNKKKLPMVLGIGGNDTKKVLDEIEKTELSDFKAILSVCPYYNKPSQNGIYQHYKKIAKITDLLKIIVYNVPKRTGVNIKTKTIPKLAKKYKNIIAIKEASGDILQLYEIIKKKPKNFNVICGDDNIFLPSILGGASGVISVIAQAIPKEYSNIIDLIKKNNIKEAYKSYYKIFDIINLTFREGNPSGIKTLLKIIGLCDSHVRLPLTEISNKLKKKLNIHTI